jgi:regulator of RNase E activity RraA
MASRIDVPDAVLSTLSRAAVAIVSDILQALGDHAHHLNGPLPVNRERLAGRAVTLAYLPVGSAGDAVRIDPLDVIAGCAPGDVLVMTTGGPPLAFWGEHMVDLALSRGIAGAVVDGPIRDRAIVRERPFALFHQGLSPSSSLSAYGCYARDEPVTLGGARIEPGDVVLGDEDGVVVVPAASAEPVAARVEAFERLEQEMADAMAAGEAPSAVYARIHEKKQQVLR